MRSNTIVADAGLASTLGVLLGRVGGAVVGERALPEDGRRTATSRAVSSAPASVIMSG
jgi:hypothetical protein